MPSGKPQRSTTNHDKQIGVRIRQARLAKDLTQDGLGKKLGISFQQIQKYENGTNRVSASRLYEIAETLDLPVTYFYGDEETATPEAYTDRVIRVARELDGIDDGVVKDQVFQLIKTLSRNQNTPAVAVR